MPDEQTKIRPVPLPANSFNFRETEKALDAAVSVKDEAKHPQRIAEAVRESANLKDVLEAQDRPATPEGTEMGQIETQTGQKIDAPVAIAAKADTGQEAAEQELDSTADAQQAAESGGATTAGDEGAGGSRSSRTK